MQRYTNNIQTQTGQAIGGALVTVLNFPSLTPATIYLDNNSTPLANPIVTDSNGFFAFYAVNGRYSIAISGPNIKPYQVDDILSEDLLNKTLYVSDYDTLPHAVTAGLGNRLVVPQGTTLTVNVPGDVATTQAAMTAIRGWAIYGAVNISVAAGTISEAAGVSLAHPFGENINIFGPSVTPGTLPTATISFNGTSGFYVPRGFTFGTINYLNVSNTGARGLTLAVYSDGGKIASVGPTLRISGFYYGVAARFGAYIGASGTGPGVGTIVSGAGDASFWSYGGVLECQFCNGSGANDSGNNLGTGFVCEFGGSMDATNSTATGCFLAGYGVLSNGAIRGWGITSSTNGNGLNLVGGGVIEVFNGATITNNTGYGYISDGDGIVDGWSTATVSGNTSGDHSITARPLIISSGTVNSTPIGSTARAAGSFTTLNANGALTLDGGGPSVTFNTGGPTISVPATNVLSFNNGLAAVARLSASSNFLVGTTTDDGSGNKLQVNGGISISPPASVTPATNGQMTFQLTSNTSLAIKVKGSDGVVRSTTLTLA